MLAGADHRLTQASARDVYVAGVVSWLVRQAEEAPRTAMPPPPRGVRSARRRVYSRVPGVRLRVRAPARARRRVRRSRELSVRAAAAGALRTAAALGGLSRARRSAAAGATASHALDARTTVKSKGAALKRVRHGENWVGPINTSFERRPPRPDGCAGFSRRSFMILAPPGPLGKGAARAPAAEQPPQADARRT